MGMWVRSYHSLNQPIRYLGADRGSVVASVPGRLILTNEYQVLPRRRTMTTGHGTRLHLRAQYQLASIVLLSIVSLAEGKDVGDLQARFFQEAPIAWREYLDLASHTQGEGGSKQIESKTGKILNTGMPFQFKLDGTLGLFLRQARDKPKRLEAQNDKYQFIVASPNSNDASIVQLIWDDWSTGADLVSAISPRGSDAIGAAPWRAAMAYACQGLLVDAVWLPKIFSSPSFKVVKASAVKSTNEDLIRIDFEYNPPEFGNNRVRNGYVELDPSRYWLIRAAEVDGYQPNPEWRAKIRIDNEYDDSTLGFPYATRHTTRTVSSIADFKDVYDTTMRKMDASDIGPFQLSSNGFPAPEDPRHRRRSYLVFWNLEVIFFLLAAILFYRFSRAFTASTAVANTANAHGNRARFRSAMSHGP